MITTIVLLILAVVTIMAGVTIVPNQYAIVVERLGRYHSTLTAGFHVLIPFIDRKAATVSLRPMKKCMTWRPRPASRRITSP